jgi:predicted 2-oxoglutarate/Fe(II)-dependent dioxygenase YbiX
MTEKRIEYGHRPPQLHVMEKFITEEELSIFRNLLLGESDWVKQEKYYPDIRQHYTLSNEKGEHPDLLKIDREIKNRIHEALEKHYGQLLFIPTNLSYNRWMIGDEIRCHNDSGHPWGELIVEERGNENPPVPISEHFNDYASVVYLTDDYDGGEFFFNYLDYKIKPSAGDVITFPANHFYTHGVTEMLSGERITITLFWPGVRSICLSLVSEVYKNWWKRVDNPEQIWKVIPQKYIDSVDHEMLPERPVEENGYEEDQESDTESE